jgi:hypothetical protein
MAAKQAFRKRAAGAIIIAHHRLQPETSLPQAIWQTQPRVKAHRRQAHTLTAIRHRQT